MIRYFKWKKLLVIVLLLIVTDLILCSNEGITCEFELDFCGWNSDNWIRRNKSKFGTSGPQEPAHGDFFAQIDSEISNRDSTLKVDFSKPVGISCIKFRHHLYGDYSKELKFGYYVSSGILTVLNTIKKKENFWGCSTVVLSDLPSQAQGIFFQAETGENAFSIIALDSITFNQGNEKCNDVANCPVPKPPPTTTTKQPSTVTPTDKTSGSSNEIWFIVGGGCGGVVLLAIIIIILCIVKRRRSKRDIPSLPSASFLNNPNSRQLPAIPCDQNISNGSIMSIAESYDRKFSIQPTPDPIALKNDDEVWKNEHVQTQPTDPIMLKNDDAWENEHVSTETDNNRVASTDYTDILETSPVRENKNDLSDYIHVPPDYPNDDETSQKDYIIPEEEKQSNEEDENAKIEHNETKKDHIYMNEPDDDYLEPINALGESIRAPDNQYESDPTDKGSKTKTSPVNLCVAPYTEEHLEIPQIPVMHREKYHLNAENKEDTDNDYDDAATVLNGYTTENSDQDELYDNSKGEKDTNSIKSDNEDYLYMSENRKEEDCDKPTKDGKDNSWDGQDNNSVNSDKEDYFDMSENRQDEDYVKPTIDTS